MKSPATRNGQQKASLPTLAAGGHTPQVLVESTALSLLVHPWTQTASLKATL